MPAVIQGTQRSLPDHVSVVTSTARKPTDKLSRLVEAFTRIPLTSFIQEIRKNLQIHGLGEIIWRVIIYLDDAHRVYEWLSEGKRNCELDIPGSFFYSYWMRGQALGLAMFKKENPAFLFCSRVHGGDLYQERYSPPYIPFRAEIMAAVDRVFTVSKHGEEYIKTNYPSAATKTDYIPLGVKAPGFITRNSTDNMIRLVSCSSLIPVKRPELILAGIAEFGKNNPDQAIEWHHLGGGSLLEDISRLAMSALPKNVRAIFHGKLLHQQIYDFYENNPVDLFINLSSSEGTSVAIMEALSCGIPVVATDVGGTSEMVNTKNGFLLSANPEPAEVAAAIDQVIAEIESKTRAARETWEESYNSSSNYGYFVDVLEDIIS